MWYVPGFPLASASLLPAGRPAATVKKLPRYPSVPAVRMGRLAVDLGFRGQGLGSALFADALDLAARAEIAAYALPDASIDDAVPAASDSTPDQCKLAEGKAPVRRSSPTRLKDQQPGRPRPETEQSSMFQADRRSYELAKTVVCP